MERFHRDFHALGGDGPEVLLEEFADLAVVLIRDQTHRDLGRSLGGNHRLGALLDVAAPDAVHVERGPYARAFERREARFALDSADRKRLLVLREAERRLVESPAFGGSELAHIVVEARRCVRPVRAAA